MTVRVRIIAVAVLACAGASAFLAARPAEDKKPPAVPFYRKYLVPGNKLDDQIIEQEQRISSAPNDAALHNDMGNLLAARHFGHEAAEQYEIASKLDKGNFISYYNLGLLRETEGKFSQAIGAYQKSIDRKHGFPPAHFRLGRLYEKSERTDEAITQYATAFRIDPSMRDRRRNPLVIDSELTYRASLVNYPSDVASASLGRDTVFVEEGRFRAVPVDRPVTAQEVAGEDAEIVPEPRNVGPGEAAGAASTEPASAGPGPGRAHPGARPTPRAASQPARGRAASAPGPRGGTPMVAVPPGSNVPPPPPPVELTPPPAAEPETPPDSMQEPTPAAPVEEEPSR
ncbi:MAG TPA: tetratricopeptide repeat protein [Thermoanaerobaculia bacterium]